MSLVLREITGPWNNRLIVRPTLLVWNYQNHPYLRAAIEIPTSGQAFSILKQFRWHARRTEGQYVTNFKVERGAYPQAGMKLWFAALPVLDTDLEDTALYNEKDPYSVNYFPAAVGALSTAPNLEGVTGVEVAASGAGVVFDKTVYSNRGFVGHLMKFALGIDNTVVGTGSVPGPSLMFSYEVV